MNNKPLAVKRIHQVMLCFLLCTVMLCISCSVFKKEDPYVTYLTQVLQTMYSLQTEKPFLDFIKIKKLNKQSEIFAIYCNKSNTTEGKCNLPNKQNLKEKPIVLVKKLENGRYGVYLNEEPMVIDLYIPCNSKQVRTASDGIPRCGLYWPNESISKEDILVRARYYEDLYDALRKNVTPNDITENLHTLLLNYYKYSFEQFEAFYSGMAIYNIGSVKMSSDNSMFWNCNDDGKIQADDYIKYQKMAGDSWDEYHRKIQGNVLQNKLGKELYFVLFPMEAIALEKAN